MASRMPGGQDFTTLWFGGKHTLRVAYHFLQVTHCSRQKVKQDEFSVSWLRRVACKFVILFGQAVVENYTRAGRKLERRSFPITFQLSVLPRFKARNRVCIWHSHLTKSLSVLGPLQLLYIFMIFVLCFRVVTAGLQEAHVLWAVGDFGAKVSKSLRLWLSASALEVLLAFCRLAFPRSTASTVNWQERAAFSTFHLLGQRCRICDVIATWNQC